MTVFNNRGDLFRQSRLFSDLLLEVLRCACPVPVVCHVLVPGMQEAAVIQVVHSGFESCQWVEPLNWCVLFCSYSYVVGQQHDVPSALATTATNLLV